MSLFSDISNLFKPRPNNPGLLLDDPALLESLPRHELFAGGNQKLINDWTEYCPPFRYQGPSYWCTAFAGSSIGYIFEKLQNGSSPLFSPIELFYRTGGSMAGNYLLSTAKGMQKSLVNEEDVPTPIPDRWSAVEFLKYRAQSYASEQALKSGERFRLASAATVGTNPSDLRAALSASPLYIAVGIGRGYFDKVAPRQTQYSAYHAVVLSKIEEDGRFKIFDSLTQTQKFDGFHYLAPDYEIIMALSFIDVPENWKAIQAQPTEHGALQQYGRRRILPLEQQKAEELRAALKFHPTVSAAIGRYWTICVNALAYGDYTIQDLLNHYTSIRRTGRPIFNFNRPAHDQ